MGIIIRAIIAIVLGLLAAWVAGHFVTVTIANLIGLLVGLLFFFGYGQDDGRWRW